MIFSVGDRVEKWTGDYQLPGEVRAAFTTRAGKIRYVVEHDCGILHIYSGANLRPWQPWWRATIARLVGAFFTYARAIDK